MHTWDLARAIGRSAPLDTDVAERGLAFMSASLTDENRGRAFGPEQSPLPLTRRRTTDWLLLRVVRWPDRDSP